MRKMLIALVALTALTGVACGGGGNDGGAATGATGGTGAGCTAATATDLTRDDPFVVTIQGLAFHPNCFAAKSASSITIVNKDTVTHTFTIDGTQVDVTIPGGQTFNGESAGLAPGTYPFHCKIHRTMTGTVIVS
ncbi:MAG: cupredoxin domain-containing protein [Actinomycetota bacterium]